MALHTQYRRDKNTAWLTVTADVEIECSHFDPRQPEYVAIMTKLTKPVRKLVEHGMLPPDKDRAYAVRAFTMACVKGWRTVVPSPHKGELPTYRAEINVRDDEWLPFSIDNAVGVFTAYPQFYSDTVEVARDLSAFPVSEEETKNFKTV